MKEEEKRNWRFNWLELIFEFSHLEYQKGLWVDVKYQNIIGSFNEDICQYFDDLFINDNYEYQLKKGIISKEEFRIIEDFHFEFNRFVESTTTLEEKFSEAEILENKEWIKVCALGRIAWDRIKKSIKDTNEKEHMIALEHKYVEDVN